MNKSSWFTFSVPNLWQIWINDRICIMAPDSASLISEIRLEEFTYSLCHIMRNL